MRFRRRDDTSDPGEGTQPADGDALDPQSVAPAMPRDADEVELDPEDPTRLDLGGLVVAGRQGVDIRLNVEERTGQVTALLLVTQEGAAEVRAFAAPRNEDLWEGLRRQVAADVTQRGGTASEVEGPFGPALDVELTGRSPEGQTVVQRSRVVGIAGPRWLLRVTLLGRPSTEWRDGGLVEQALGELVVRRGSGPMAPGEPLPLTVPAGARPATS